MCGPEGQSFTAAARRLMYLVREARRRGLSGVDLKDESETPVLPAQTQVSQGNFLVNGEALGPAREDRRAAPAIPCKCSTSMTFRLS